MMYYLNDDKTYRKCSTEEWAFQFETMNRHVGDDMIDGHLVSTVWLGTDHNFYGGVPLLLETMVFSEPRGGTDIYMRRYTTWEQAVEGHKKAIQWVRDGCKNDE